MIVPRKEKDKLLTTTHLRARQALLDPFNDTDKRQTIAIMFLHTGSDRQYVRVKK